MSHITKKLADGVKVPALAFGTGTALFGHDAAKQVLQALEAGITHIDTAQAYRNEDSVGDALSEWFSKGNSRSSLFITTKLITLKPGDTVRANLKVQLKKLKLDYVDLYLYHTPTGSEGRLAEIWRGFEEVKKEGLVKEIGVSNFRVKDFDEFLGGAKEYPAVNQIEFHPYVLKASLPILELHKKYGITLASYGGQTPIFRQPDGPLSKVLPDIRDRLAKESGKTVTEGQVLFKWLYAKDAIAVSTSSKKERLQEYIAAESLPDLTKEEVDAIDNAGAEHHQRFFQRHMDN